MRTIHEISRIITKPKFQNLIGVVSCGFVDRSLGCAHAALRNPQMFLPVS